jgi:N-acyl homoserine lactone hydrolase
VTRPPAKGLYLLRLGTATVDVPTFLPMEPERGPSYASPVAAYLIVGEQRILVDTGLSDAHLDDPGARIQLPAMRVGMRSSDRLVRQLARIGACVDDIDAVICTHFDFDHCGENRLFPGRPMYVQQTHLAYATSRPDRCDPRDWDHDLDYIPVDGDTELSSSVTLLETSGHAPGHQSVLVRTRSATVILAADAAFTYRMFREERVAGCADEEGVRASIRKLKRIARSCEAEVIVGHDADAWASRYEVLPRRYR